MWRYKRLFGGVSIVLSHEAWIVFVCASMCNPKKCVCVWEGERESAQKMCPFTLAFIIPPFLCLAQGGPAFSQSAITDAGQKDSNLHSKTNRNTHLTIHKQILTLSHIHNYVGPFNPKIHVYFWAAVVVAHWKNVSTVNKLCHQFCKQYLDIWCV